MILTNEEIEAIANCLDEILGDNFHDAICNVIGNREYIDLDDAEASDEDILKIKQQLKRIL